MDSSDSSMGWSKLTCELAACESWTDTLQAQWPVHSVQSNNTHQTADMVTKHLRAGGAALVLSLCLIRGV